MNLAIEENGVRLKLTVVDTPGFGDFVNNEEWWVSSELSCSSELTACDVAGGQLSITSKRASMRISSRRTGSTECSWSTIVCTHASTSFSRQVIRERFIEKGDG